MSNKLMEKIVELGIQMDEKQSESLANLLKGYKDQKTIDEAVVTQKIRARNKVLEDLGVKTVEELKEKLEQAYQSTPKSPTTPVESAETKSGAGANDLQQAEFVKMMTQKFDEQNKMIQSLQSNLQSQQQAMTKRDQIQILRSKGFTPTQADKMYSSLSAQVTEDKSFDAVLKEAESDALFKPQFDIANKQLQSGTIELAKNDSAPALDQTNRDLVRKAFGLTDKQTDK